MTFAAQQSQRPRARNNSNGVIIPDSMIDEAFQGQYDGSNNLIYKGFARPGSPTSQPVWQIAKLTYDGSGNVTSIQWPVLQDSAGVNSSQASNDYLFIWDNRASLTYL